MALASTLIPSCPETHPRAESVQYLTASPGRVTTKDAGTWLVGDLPSSDHFHFAERTAVSFVFTDKLTFTFSLHSVLRYLSLRFYCLRG